MYLQECKVNNRINKSHIVQTFAEQSGHELTWKTFEKRLYYLNSLYTSICKSCTPDQRTGMLTMTNEAWAQTTKVRTCILLKFLCELIDFCYFYYTWKFSFVPYDFFFKFLYSFFQRHPELLNPNSKPLVELLMQRMTTRLQSKSNDISLDPSGSDHGREKVRPQYNSNDSGPNLNGMDHCMNLLMLS